MTFRRVGRMLGIVALLAALLCMASCDDVQPQLVGTPTPSASPTPLPDAFTAEMTAAPVPTDQLGNEILSEEHYYQYLSFGDIRVYEYEDGTFWDGVCVNAYPLPLDGQIDVVYRTADTGKLCGVGSLHNAEGGTLLETGANALYGEIETDIDVRMMDFTLEVKRTFQPVLPEESPSPSLTPAA